MVELAWVRSAADVAASVAGAAFFFWGSMMMAREPVIRISEPEAIRAAIVCVQPEYPPVARQMQLAGSVQAEVYVNTKGAVENIKVLNGHPLLAGAAVTALRQWKFAPFTAGGAPTRAIAGIRFDFQL